MGPATSTNASKLFRASCIAAGDSDGSAGGPGFDRSDEVTDEIARSGWEALPVNSKEIECFRKADGLIDELALPSR
jgi:hypothetical protein